MPRAGCAAKSGGKGGLLVGVIVVVVILAGAGVGAYFWNRSSAVSTTQQYMDAAMGLFKTGQPDVEGLKRVLVKEQVAEVERAEGPLFDMANSPLGKFLMTVKASYEVGEATVGMKEATVNVKLTMALGQQSSVREMKVALVREGVAWKVDGRKTQTSEVGGGAPKL